MQTVWLTIKFTTPRQYVNFLEARSELQAAEQPHVISAEGWVVVAMRQRFVVFDFRELLETSGVGCGLASS